MDSPLSGKKVANKETYALYCTKEASVKNQRSIRKELKKRS